MTKTRASVPKPPRKGFLPIKSVDRSADPDNMREEKFAPMTFSVPKSWHTRFKMTATAHGMSMKDLLVESFALWERENERKISKAGGR